MEIKEYINTLNQFQLTICVYNTPLLSRILLPSVLIKFLNPQIKKINVPENN